MDKKIEEKKTFPNQTVNLDNRKILMLTGVTKMISANEDCVIAEVGNSNLRVEGKELHISKLDVENGNLNITGVVNALKYSGSNVRESFFKRIFK